MEKPVIGIVSLYDYEKKSLWMLPGYVEGVTGAGAVPVILPLVQDRDSAEEMFLRCDGILFTGGQDVSPELYGEEKKPWCHETCPERDNLEKMLLPMCVAENKPFLGICRGIQLVNAVMGGNLWQDIPTENPSGITHRMQFPYNRKSHEVRVVKGSPLHTLTAMDTLQVNSCHHQAIKTLAPGLDVMAAAEDGIVEAVCLKGNSFGWAVQWHPEMWYEGNETSKKIFRAFVGAAEDYRQNHRK